MEQQDSRAQAPLQIPAHLLTLVCWSLFAAQAWLAMIGLVLFDREEETDGGEVDGQLPVPDPIQDSMDSEIFA